MDWFRSYHGAPTDKKWILIASKANSKPGVVAAVWWALMDRASQAKPRGSVAGFDLEALAAFYGWPADEVVRVVDVFRARGMITDADELRKWVERNPPDYSSERVRKYRMKRNETDETKGNARKHRGEERRVEEKKPSVSKRKPRKPETELPVDWTPTEAHRAKVQAAGLDMKREAERFRNYHGAKGSLFRDWGLAFHTWLDNAAERLGHKRSIATPIKILRPDTGGYKPADA